MGSFSIWHLLILFVLLVVPIMIVLFVLPIWRILSRMGFSGAWSLLVFVPFGTLVGLYIVAFSAWPLEKKNATTFE